MAFKIFYMDVISLFFPIADGIGKLFGPSCEVVIHSLKDLSSSVVKIVNPQVTGREVGAPMTDMGIEIIERSKSEYLTVVGPYTTKTESGKPLFSFTFLLRDFEDEVIGFLCINLDLSVSLIDFIKIFSLKMGKSDVPSPEHFPLSTTDLVKITYDQARTEVTSQDILSRSECNKYIVRILLNKNIFSIKGAIDLVAHEMQVSRYTIYNYIREAKIQNRKKQ